MVQGRLAPRGRLEDWRWTEKGPDDTPCLLLSTPPESAWAADSSHRRLPAHCPSWGRGGHRGSPPGAGRGGTETASLMLAASPGKASLKSRLVPRWKDQIEEHDSCDTCRKEWFSEHPSRGLSPRAAEGPTLLREKVVPGGRTPSSSSTDQFTGFGAFLYKGPRHRQPWKNMLGSGNSATVVFVLVGCGGHTAVSCLLLPITWNR